MPTKTKLTRSKRVPRHIRGNIKNSKYEIKRKTKTRSYRYVSCSFKTH